MVLTQPILEVGNLLGNFTKAKLLDSKVQIYIKTYQAASLFNLFCQVTESQRVCDGKNIINKARSLA